MSGTGNSTISVPATGDQLIDGVLSGIAWGDTVVTYSFPTSAGEYGSQASYSPYGELATFGTISLLQQNAARWALDTAYGNSANDGFSVEGFTNLTIEYTTDANANIRYGETDAANPTAYAYYPGSHPAAGDVWFGTSHNYGSPQAGTYEWATMLHETGHALGLSHGHDTSGNGALPSEYDSMEYSIMTYRSYVGQPTGGGYTNETYGYAQTYMMADIAALQEMYGADYTTNSGDTVYSWDPASGDTLINGQVAIDAAGNRIFATIWDGGGIDTYDLSAYTTDLQIDLTPGEHSVFSDVQLAYLGNGNYSRGNIFNALLYNDDPGSLIENA
ncbi:MAG: M10 family metallopeptidase, partial [Marinosulfonomonas sp.]|nr:M10 family metallopeptidase [Marinosulfonomonas sp.]